MKIPKKPESLEEQISMIWDAVFNHLFTAQYWQGVMTILILQILRFFIEFWH